MENAGLADVLSKSQLRVSPIFGYSIISHVFHRCYEVHSGIGKENKHWYLEVKKKSGKWGKINKKCSLLIYSS